MPPVKDTAKQPEIPDFGIVFPPGIPLIQRRLYCALHNRGTEKRWIQRKEIIKALWKCSEPGDKETGDFAWHRWNEKRLQGLCTHRFNTWAGPGGSGKSSDAGMFGLQWWLESPHRSALIVCSTTKDLLRKRIWAQIAHFHRILTKRFPKMPLGELIDSETKIRWEKGDDKNCIFGMAIDDGPVEEAINNLIGIHTHRVFLILDEMQGVRPPIVSPKVLGNIAKNPEAYCLGMGNPESQNDPMGLFSEPLGGWSSVVLGETEQWETRGGPFKGNGLCQAFNGQKSPADDSEEEGKRLNWLIRREWIQAHLDSVNGNEKDPSFLSQAIGIWPGGGLESTVLDDATITTFKCKEKAIWTQKPTKFAALDPAWEGRDQRILQFGRRGLTEADGKLKWMIDFDEWLRVPIVADSEEPLHYQIYRFVRKECEVRGIPANELAIDSTGEGGGLLSIFHMNWGPVVGIEFGGRPSEIPVSESDSRPASEVYDRRVSELNLSLRTFATTNSLRGLSTEACAQACARKTEYKSKRYRVETKTDMKKRIGRSPDNLDAVAIGIDLCRQRGAVPSATKSVSRIDYARAHQKAAEDFESGYACNEYA